MKTIKTFVGTKHFEDMHEYLVKNNFKAGDVLQFHSYVTGNHTHWEFENPIMYRKFEVVRVGGKLSVKVFMGHHKFYIERNFDFIFSKEVEEFVEYPSWSGKYFGHMSEEEKVQFFLYVLSGNTAWIDAGDEAYNLNMEDIPSELPLHHKFERFMKYRAGYTRYFATEEHWEEVQEKENV